MSLNKKQKQNLGITPNVIQPTQSLGTYKTAYSNGFANIQPTQDLGTLTPQTNGIINKTIPTTPTGNGNNTVEEPKPEVVAPANTQGGSTAGDLGGDTNGGVIIEKPLQNAYDTFKAQADLDKLSEQNEIANATKLAQSYMDNYLKHYGMQGSGMGQSAYANLGANQTKQMAEVNREYNASLADYRNQFNQGLKDDAAIDMQSMTPEQQQEYINKFVGQSGVDQATINSMQSQANAINYDRQQEYNKQVLAEAPEKASTMSDEDWEAYVERQKNNGVDENTLQSLEDYRKMYGTSSFETSQDEWAGTITAAIDTAIEDGDIDKVRELREIYSLIDGAETQEELDNAISQFEQLDKKDYYKTNVEDIGATTGTGSKESPYVFDKEKLGDLKDLAEEGKLKEGDWVQYTNSSGKIILRQVNENGKLINREDKGYPKGSYNNPYKYSTKEEVQKLIDSGVAKEGEYYGVGSKYWWSKYKIKDGKLVIVN